MHEILFIPLVPPVWLTWNRKVENKKVGTIKQEEWYIVYL